MEGYLYPENIRMGSLIAGLKMERIVNAGGLNRRDNCIDRKWSL